MKIRRIKLNNFKSYYGEQTFNFSSGLNIISGKIGTGKTSLFEAFQWILLDNVTNSKPIEKEFIVNKKFENESILSEKSKIQCSVLLEVENENTVYEIYKTNEYKLNGEKYDLLETKFSINYDEPRTGNSKIIVDKREVEAKLDLLFPEKLRRYLLFKGETLNQLIDFSNPVTLEQAVKQISYLPLFTRMTKIINELITKTERKYRNKLQANTRDKNKFNQYNAQLEKKENELIINNKKFEKAQKDIDELEEKENDYTDKLSFIAGFPDLKEEESRLKYKLKNTYDELESLDISSKEKFINKWILAKGHPLLDKAELELRKFIDWRENQIKKNKEQLELGIPGDYLIKRMIKEKKCLICGTTESEKTDLLETIEKHLDKNKKFENVLSDEIEDLNDKVKDIVKNVSFIKNSTSDIKQDLKKYVIRNREKEAEIAKTKESINKVSEKIDDLVKEKGYRILQLDPKAITNALSNLKSELKTLRGRKDFYERENKNLESEIRNLNKKLEGLEGIESLDVNVMPEKRALNHLEEINKIIQRKVKIEKVNLIEKIEDEANNIQQNIIEQSKDNDIVVLYVKIDKGDYSVSFVDSEGNPNPGHGAQETLAKMSLISSVLKLSNDYKQESYPFIVDAPASNFDETITKPFIKSVSDNFSQGIVILKDIHLEIDLYKQEDFTNTIYTIEKLSEKDGNSTVQNNYTKINSIK